ncbi:MAG: type II CRISPR RNA-guided endonuclease Cas9 [Kiritimatiellia bacterium]
MGKIKQNEVGIHLDVGHDSIGWCVSDRRPNEAEFLRFLGAGVVLFPADDCLACERRAFRRQRRHIRSTRQRIARLKLILLARGVLSEKELDSNPVAFPWKLAADVLVGGKLLSWLELWCVLRWYAHNRGYDGNVLSSLRSGRQIDQKDIEKNAAARDLMKQFGTGSMAETMCRYLDVKPTGGIVSSMKRFKELKVSFDRTVVVAEVTKILGHHLGVLPKLDADLMHLVLADPAKEGAYLRTRTDLPFRVPARYWGGLLFGQLAPRFDNRLIGTCPVSGVKLPGKATPEFLNYRWAMMLANTCVGEAGRPLRAEERVRMTEDVRRVGGYTKAGYRKLVVETTGEQVNNVDALLTAPDADKSLVCYPGLYELTRRRFDTVLPDEVLKKLAHHLVRGKSITVGAVREFVSAEKQGAFDELINSGKRKGGKKAKSAVGLLEERIMASIPSGRAPYARGVLVQVTQDVLAGKDPREKGGILYRDASKMDILPEEKVDRETNNHLIRHRVKILLRLLKDIVRDYAENNPARIAQVTIEMARDLKEFSGKTQKEITIEMNQKTAQHRRVAKKLAELLNCKESRLSASLIRKARVAEDMGYVCPYTGWKYDLQDVVSKNVDLDHILPRSQRATDSLDSMVLTFTEVNRMKDNRTGLEFIRACGGQRVNGRDNLVILNEAKYRSLVDGVKPSGSPDDRARQKRRTRNLLMFHTNEAGMTEGMLTRTSYITTLASKAIRGFFVKCGRMPRIVSIPGRVTAELRKQWNILGILAVIDQRVLDDDGKLRLKSEIRGITHMHHAVDAITLGLAATLLPCDGTFWAMMCKRRVKLDEVEMLRPLGVFRFTTQNEPRLIELPDFLKHSIKTVLAEQRVVVHQPVERFGLKVEQKVWGVEKIDGNQVYVRQRERDEKTGKPRIKRKVVQAGQTFGLNPRGGHGKLKDIKGVLLPDVNFGVALTNPPQVIRYHKVWGTLGKIGQGRIPPVIRRGGLIRVAQGNYSGVWRVASVKDADQSISLDLLDPSATKVANKVSYAKINVRLQTLVKNGLQIIKPSYTGMPKCPITSSTSQVKVQSSQ